MTETQYQRKLIKTLKQLFPGCIVLKNDPEQLQGISDLTVLYGPYWALLEVKISGVAPEQPNQRYYVDYASDQSFGAFIHPGNEEEVLRELQLAFQTLG